MDRERGLGVVCAKVGKPGGRSSLFWWMLEHHDRLLEAAAGRRFRWRDLCGEFAALGLSDVEGKPVSAETARKTWARARRENARLNEFARAAAMAKAEVASVRAHFPSRQPTSLRPRVAGQAFKPAPMIAVPAPESAATPKPWEDPRLTPAQAAHMKEQLEKLDRQQEWNDRTVRPLTKERFEELANEFDWDRRGMRELERK